MCLKTYVIYFFTVLGTPSDDSQWWPNYVNANFYLPLLNLLHFMDLTTHLCVKGCIGSRCLLWRVVCLKEFCILTSFLRNSRNIDRELKHEDSNFTFYLFGISVYRNYVATKDVWVPSWTMSQDGVAVDNFEIPSSYSSCVWTHIQTP